MPKKTPTAERIESKINRNGPPAKHSQTGADIGPCWLWTASIDTGGYGSVQHGGRVVPAHRAVYEVLVGAIPEGKHLDHLCRVTACVNPAHLEPVTRSQNMRRGRTRRDDTHCRAGHPFGAEVDKHGYRVCVACRDARRVARRRS